MSFEDYLRPKVKTSAVRMTIKKWAIFPCRKAEQSSRAAQYKGEDSVCVQVAQLRQRSPPMKLYIYIIPQGITTAS